MSTTPQPASGGSLEIGRGFGFVFDDPGWIKKLLMGGLFALLSSVIVGLFFVGGYLVRLMQRTARGEEQPLPDWDDLGGIFSDGLKVVGVYFGYACGFGLLMISLGCLIGLLGGGMGALLGEEGAEELVGAGLALAVVAFYVAIIGLSLVLAIYLPAAVLRTALSGSFGAGFEIRENVAFIGRNVGNYLLVLLLYLAAAFLSQFGILLLCVGVFPAAFWSYCVGAWALAETARRDPAYR